jgi:mono/diheme cytochrome c family protein
VKYLRPLLLAILATASTSALCGDAPQASESVVAQGHALYHGAKKFAHSARIGNGDDATLLPTANAACVSCHGSRGDGAREAGTQIPSVRWQRLRSATTTLPAYASGDAIAAAIEHALGRKTALTSAMPRYALTDAERVALIAYLQVLGTDADLSQGINSKQVLVGAVLPLQGNLRPLGEVIQQGLQARIDVVNAQGGVFGRKLTLVVEDTGTSARSTHEAIRRLVQERGVFALVGSYLPEDVILDDATMEGLDTAFVATLGIPLRSTQQRRVTYLMPSVEQQLAQLWSQLALRCNSASGIDVFYAPIPGLTAAIRDSAKKAGLDNSVDALHLREIRQPQDIDDQPANKFVKGRPTVALVNSAALTSVRTSLQSSQIGAGKDACLASLAIFSGAGNATPSSDLPYARALVSELITLPMPPVVRNESTSGNHNSNDNAGMALWQMLADVAMRTFVEALSRSGREVDHPRFERALMTLRRFEPIAGLSLDFSPQQRHGLAVSSIWKGDSQ